MTRLDYLARRPLDGSSCGVKQGKFLGRPWPSRQLDGPVGRTQHSGRWGLPIDDVRRCTLFESKLCSGVVRRSPSEHQGTRRTIRQLTFHQ